MDYIPFVPGITVAGKTLAVFIDTLASFPVLREALLEVLGVPRIDDDEWFPQDLVLRAYQKVDYLLGGRGLERFGTAVPALAEVPPHIDGAHAVLAALDVVFHVHHRRDGATMIDLGTGVMTEGIGHYHYERTGEREAIMVCDNPYPCRFDIGLCRGFAGRFAPTATAEHIPGSCRLDGDTSCAYKICW